MLQQLRAERDREFQEFRTENEQVLQQLRVERDREFQEFRTENEQVLQQLRVERDREFQESRAKHEREMQEIRETVRENSLYVQVLTRNVDRLMLRSESQQNFFEQIFGEIREIRGEMREMKADIRGLQQENRRILEILFDRWGNGA